MKSRYLVTLTIVWLVLHPALLAIPEHPRLLVTAADWKNPSSRMKGDPRVNKIISATIARDNLTLPNPLISYQRDIQDLSLISPLDGQSFLGDHHQTTEILCEIVIPRKYLDKKPTKL